MAIRSMTGFGRGEAKHGGIHVIVELSAVNRKQLDIRLNLPPSLAAFEPELQAILQRRISRGAVNASVWIACSGGAGSRNAVDERLAGAYLANLRRTARRLGLKDDLTAATLIGLPGVVKDISRDVPPGKVRPLAKRALTQAADALVDAREREGRALAADLKTRLNQLQKWAGEIEQLAPSVTEHYRKRLQERLAPAGLAVDLKDERLLKEIALFADRSDISEEITRLKSHLKQAFAHLLSEEPVGRPLDFLAQELFREINTTGSKSNDIGITRLVLAFKAELERIREQVQNLE